jgi:type III secretion protein T
MSSASPLSGLIEIVTLLQPLVAALPRVGVALLVLPLLPRNLVPLRLKAGFVLSLTLVTYPLMAANFHTNDWSVVQWGAYVLKESLIGGLLGYAMAVMIWMMATLGELIDTQAGFNNAKIFDPFAGHSAGPLSVLLGQLGILLFVTLGGLHIFLQLLYDSLILWPPESFFPQLTPALKDYFIHSSGSVLEFATRLAAPVIGALLIVELGVGLINRIAPQLNSFYFAMPVKAIAGLLMLALLLSHMVDIVRTQFAESQTLLQPLGSFFKGP